MYYIYMLRCIDNSIYTGITTQLERRMTEHFTQSDKCSKYTLYHIAKKLEAVWTTQNKSMASKLEYQIKQLTKLQKEEIIQQKRAWKEILVSKIDIQDYKKIGKIPKYKF